MGYITKLPFAIYCALSLVATANMYAGGQLDGSVQPILVSGPGTMSPGNYYTITITVNEAGSSATQIDLSSSDTSELTTASSVTIDAGDTQVQTTVYVPASAPGGTPTISATANDGEANMTPTVQPD